MLDCLFCKMVSGEIPCQKIFENDQVLGFEDIHPLARIHHLFIHKEHCRDVTAMTPGQIEAVFAALKQWSKDCGELASGFRIVTNVGRDAGQSVFHAHFHLLGGEELGPFGRASAGH